MKTTRYTTTALNQQELSVSTTTAPMETMTKISLVLGRCQNQAVENGLTVLTLPQLENMDAYIDIPLNEAAKRNLDFYY